MGYRDVSQSLRAYRDRVAGDLETARQAAKEAAERAERVSVLEKELTETESLLRKVAGPRALPLLENVAIAAPCTADWDQMVGDDNVRFCRSCEKNVYNLSALPRDEGEALLAARESKMCVRLYKRADGTVLTSDCPVGVKRRRRRRAVAGVLGGGILAAGAALTATTSVHTMGSPLPVTGQATATAMGTVAPPPDSAIPIMGTPPVPTGDPTVVRHVMGGIAPPKPIVPPPTIKMGRPAPR
jgi:hypothetical protein